MLAGIPARPRFSLAVVALSLTATLALAQPALGAGDPVKTGSFHLSLSQAFKNRLANHGLAITPKRFAIKGGAIDPLTGLGWLTLKGKLKFKHGDEKVVFKNLNATLGPGGVLKGSGTKLFKLSGGTVTRNGFGADIGGVGLRFHRSAAKKVKRELDLNALRAGNAGSLSVSEQPATVEVITGTATLTPDGSAGSVGSKLTAHCIDSSTGVSPIAPATQPGGPGTPYFFPVTGGTVSPAGIEGIVQQVGGMQLADGGAGLPAGCPSSNTVTIRQSDLAVDLLLKHITTRVSISGPGAPFGISGDLVVNFPYTGINSTFTADPVNHTVTTNGTELQLNPAAAYYMNLAFPQPSGSFDPSLEFADGDTYGTASLTLQVR